MLCLPYKNPLLEPIWIMQKLFMINLIMTLLKIKLERIQFNAALAITRAIQRTSRDNINKELQLKSLYSRKVLIVYVHSTK